MLDELAKIREDALKRLENIKSEEELSELNTSVLGRNGALTAILRTMGKLSAERRAQLGKAASRPIGCRQLFIPRPAQIFMGVLCTKLRTETSTS